MTPFGLPILAVATAVSMAMLLVAVGAVALRMLRGPGTADRLIAMDMLGLVAVALAALIAVIAANTAFLDVGLGVALVSFLGTAAFAGFVERESGRDHPHGAAQQNAGPQGTGE